jgi:glutathione S-transferase
MRKLYHYPLCAFSRVARFILSEKRLDFEMIHENPWGPSEEVLELNVAGTLPVLVDISGLSTFGSSSIREYLEDVYQDVKLISGDYVERAESRRLADWFDFIFFQEVYSPIITEKVTKRFARGAERIPDPSSVRAALARLSVHMEYISWLVDRRNWLGGRNFSIADVYAASFISVLDYLGSIQWERFEIVKGWYARIKSRPGFRGILQDSLSQIKPSTDYANLDF